MRKKRIISAVTAFIMTASAAAVYADTSAGGKYSVADIISYLQSVNDEDSKSYLFDVNCDNKVSILDLIYSKSEALGETKTDHEKITVEYLNNIAEVLSDDFRTLAQELETNGVTLSKTEYSYKDAENIQAVRAEERGLVNQLDLSAKYHGVKKWKIVILNDKFDAACITGDAVLQRTGAYPAAVPRSLNIPFSDNLTEKAAEYYYDWKKDFGDYISSDPSQGNLSDFSVSTLISGRERTARNIFSYLQIIAVDYEAMGKKITNGKITSEDNSDVVKELINLYPECSKVKWAADISNFNISGVIVSDPRSEFCSTYPHTVPANMNISYDEKLLEYASDFRKNWMDDFSSCVTDDQEQLKYAEISAKVPTANLNSYAKTIFTAAQTIMQEYETKGITVDFDGAAESEAQHMFAEELQHNIPAEIYNKNLKWEIKSRDNVVQGVIISDPDATGAFPNAVPVNMRIPYSDEMLKYSYGSSDIWTEKYSDCVLENADENNEDPGSLSQTSKALINSYNASAKTMFTTASYIALEHEITGDVLPDGLITSDDKSAVSAEINSSVTGSGTRKWAALARNGEIIGLVYTENGNLTGSYPAPVTGALKYEHALAMRYGSNKTDW